MNKFIEQIEQMYGIFKKKKKNIYIYIYKYNNKEYYNIIFKYMHLFEQDEIFFFKAALISNFNFMNIFL